MLLIGLLQGSANRLLAMDPEAQGRIARLAGKRVRLEIKGLDRAIDVSAGDAGLVFEQAGDAVPDVALRGSILAFARAAASADEAAAGGVEAIGDADTGQAFAAVLGELDIDWDEQAARLIGDLPARTLGNLLRGAGRWGAEARASVARNLGEYLTEERRVLAPRNRLEQYLTEVDTLRAGVGRLGRRIERIQRKLDAPQ